MPQSPDTAELVTRLDRIQTLVDQLAKIRNDVIQQQDLSERIRREITAAKIALSPIKPV